MVIRGSAKSSGHPRMRKASNVHAVVIYNSRRRYFRAPVLVASGIDRTSFPLCDERTPLLVVLHLCRVISKGVSLRVTLSLRCIPRLGPLELFRVDL